MAGRGAVIGKAGCCVIERLESKWADSANGANGVGWSRLPENVAKRSFCEAKFSGSLFIVD